MLKDDLTFVEAKERAKLSNMLSEWLVGQW